MVQTLVRDEPLIIGGPGIFVKKKGSGAVRKKKKASAPTLKKKKSKCPIVEEKKGSNSLCALRFQN